jgi:hypothetical protein
MGTSGKVLGDATTVGQHNIKEKDFLVVMVTKVSARCPVRLTLAALITATRLKNSILDLRSAGQARSSSLNCDRLRRTFHPRPRLGTYYRSSCSWRPIEHEYDHLSTSCYSFYPYTGFRTRLQPPRWIRCRCRWGKQQLVLYKRRSAPDCHRWDGRHGFRTGSGDEGAPGEFQ